MSVRPLVFLIGARGTGKSTVARLLAERLDWAFLDADTELETRAGPSIRAIFAAEGEAAFRDRETAVLADVCRRTETVVATGGGVVLRQVNREAMRASGRIVWLRADAATLWQRLQSDETTAERRPALTAYSGLLEIEEVLRVREPLYRACADLIVDTAGRTPAELATFLDTALSLLGNPDG